MKRKCSGCGYRRDSESFYGSLETKFWCDVHVSTERSLFVACATCRAKASNGGKVKTVVRRTKARLRKS